MGPVLEFGPAPDKIQINFSFQSRKVEPNSPLHPLINHTSLEEARLLLMNDDNEGLDNVHFLMVGFSGTLGTTEA